jgi:SAM-dependent methyltransferase
MSGTNSQNTYVFDYSWQKERDRLRAIEALLDSSTQRLLAGRGVGPGWNCLEAGCGAGGVATWLAQQVGSSGHVLAIDLDTRFVDSTGLDNLEVRQQDLLGDELEQGAFDLAHARAVIEHIPDHEAALRRMIQALKPGGWLVIEDVDFGGPMAAAASRYFHPPRFAEAAERVLRAVEIVFAAAGAEASFGPRLPGLLQDAGLRNVGGEVRAPVVPGGSEAWVRGTVEQLSERLMETGLISDEDVQIFLSDAADPSSFYVPPFMTAAWGQRV